LRHEIGGKLKAQYQIEEMAGYLAARFIGTGTLEEVGQEFEPIAEHCKRTNNNNLLIDFRRVYANISLADRYFLGERTQIFAHYGLKVAFVGRPEQHDPRRFGEIVSQNRWVNLHVFTDVQSAEEWLLK